MIMPPIGVLGFVGSNCAIKFIKKLLFRGFMFAHSIWNMKTAFAVSADAKITGMLETYIILIG